VEANFHRSLLIGRGSYAIFFIRPLALTILLLTAMLLPVIITVAADARLRR